MQRYDDFVRKADGITFIVSAKRDGMSINVRPIPIDTVCSFNYVQPPIPEGYKYVCGKWKNGFTIERIKDGSRFVWVPVGYLNADGTLDGITFNEKFGRRYRASSIFDNNCVFSDKEYHEALTNELALQIKSINKYGGYYISQFMISTELKSEKGAMPLIDVNFNTAYMLSASFEKTEQVSSHLLFGAEYDSVLAWFIKSGARSEYEVLWNSENWGNHRQHNLGVVKTGSREEWCSNGIYDFDGNVYTFTQEQYSISHRVFRGSCFCDDGRAVNVTNRNFENPFNIHNYTGFFVALTIF